MNDDRSISQRVCGQSELLGVVQGAIAEML
jgi:hypothetical protein